MGPADDAALGDCCNPVDMGSSPEGSIMNDLIKVTKKGEPVVSSVVVAQEFGRRHDNVMQSVRSLAETGHLGLLDFKESSYLNRQRKKQPCFELTERGFLIAMPFIGGSKSRDGQVRLVDGFISIRAELARTRMERNTARLEYRPMTDAIQASRQEHGKDIKPHHFSNEADLINRIALGMTAAKFRVHHDLSKTEPIRDYLTHEQLRCVTALQRANTVYISMGWEFEARKKELAHLFDRNHRAPLIEEQHRIAA